MVSTFTPNIQIEEPARGDDVGVWDTPVNNNSTLLDLVAGGVATIALNNANVTLSAAQFQSKTITFNSTLTGSVTITFASSFKKTYEIQHLCTGSSAFTITLATTAAGGQGVCCPPGEIIDVLNDGTNIKYKNLGRIGEYMDIAGSSVPNWISGCTVPPYLNCDGSAFSSATYPQLAIRLAGTTLPDARGRARLTLDQSAGRLSSAVTGFTPNTVAAAGGDQNLQTHTHGVTDPGHSHSYLSYTSNGINGGSGGFFQAPFGPLSTLTSTTVTNISIQSGGTGAAANVQPSFMGGLTMIRAA